MKWIQTSAKWVQDNFDYFSIAVLFYVIFAQVAGFSMKQSIALALLIAWCARELYRPKAFRFRPYDICVTPDWIPLLTDFQLLNKPEEWQAIKKSFENPSVYNQMLHYGIIYLTVVHQSENSLDSLIYLNAKRAFVTEIDLNGVIEPIKVVPKNNRTTEFVDTLKFAHSVEFFMKYGHDGYNLGLVVPDRWWNETKEKCPKPMKEVSDPMIGRVHLTLATIPYTEFVLYWSPTWQSGSSDRIMRRRAIRRKEQRKKFGWKDAGHPDLPELAINWPDSIAQKYFKVEHREI
ncbi:MAG: hypothetical protein M1470_05265 [Bacteroidetes bacterium]|nr:hypothetical protein [Bacteroidota bacterium]